MRSKRENSILITILVGIFGLIVGFFLGHFFEYLSQNVDFLSFLGFLGHSLSFGLNTLSLNLLFANISFGLTMNISIMGVVTMIVFLIIYLKRR